MPNLSKVIGVTSFFYDQDGTTVSEEIPPRSEESEIRLIDGSGVYEEKVDELLATGKWRIWPFV